MIVSTPDSCLTSDAVVVPSLAVKDIFTTGLSPDGNSLNPIDGAKNINDRISRTIGVKITISLFFLDDSHRAKRCK